MYSMMRHALIAAFISLLIPPGPVAAQKSIQVSFLAGPFAPADYMVHGYHRLVYDMPGGYSTPEVLGFGTGIDIILSCRYTKSNWGVILDGGIRPHTNREFTINTIFGKRHFENKLTVIPITVSVIHKIGTGNSRFGPFIGFGTGIYFSTWETKDIYDSILIPREWYKGTDVSPGAHFMAGLDCKVFKEFVLKGEYRYSYIYSDWELESQDTDDFIRIFDLNIGGTSLRLGVGYNF